MSKHDLRSHAAHNTKNEATGASSTKPSETPSLVLHPQSEQIRNLLEELDDVIFAAITGDACALASAKTLWPKVVAEIGFDQVEESREQYLRYAIDVTRRLETQETRTPERAISALEVISLLTRN